MRKVIFKIQLTLDGFIAGPNGEMDWSAPRVGWEDDWNDTFEMLKTVDTVIMSRVIYEGFKAYWPAAATSPSTSKFEKQFSRWLDDAPKVIFSKTLNKVDWKNARLVNGNAEKEIAEMKKQPGKDFIIWGGAAFPQVLTDAGLIDEYWVGLHPLILGDGKALFADNKSNIQLEMLDNKPLKSGITRLRYGLKDK